ncbi:HNH endonuclease [Pelomonas cellulosilytica]|uniref:HNH endonuclease n=1 Tax=Pelomonas cellulosilytica TaxID=2906762 RepID=A0ABS8Y019_9BURK|nr:HNH endonuclease [Pelomonas sp. P8]MCE4556855.1 HNH endonuclease [Pelomonas sp. P8]
MQRHRTLDAFVVFALIVAPAGAKPHRSSSAVAQFKRQPPCPVNGATKGKCTGAVVDHVTPLCAGGADAPSNMQWKPLADAKRKDRVEHAQCRAMRRADHGWRMKTDRP